MTHRGDSDAAPAPSKPRSSRKASRARVKPVDTDASGDADADGNSNWDDSDGVRFRADVKRGSLDGLTRELTAEALQEAQDGTDAKARRTSVASSSHSKSSTVMFHRAIQVDAQSMEGSLVFLKRVLLIVSLTVIVVVAVTITSEQSIATALSLEKALHNEGDRAQKHTVRPCGATVAIIGCYCANC